MLTGNQTEGKTAKLKIPEHKQNITFSEKVAKAFKYYHLVVFVFNTGGNNTASLCNYT